MEDFTCFQLWPFKTRLIVSKNPRTDDDLVEYHGGRLSAGAVTVARESLGSTRQPSKIALIGT
jgi:hypothetical protein